MEKIYLVRHCKADGQQPKAQLTEEGRQQAQDLIPFFEEYPIDLIMSSTYDRAVQTAEPIAASRDLPIHEEKRLTERVFSTLKVDDWLTWMQRGFVEMDLEFEGGESGRAAQARIVEVMNELIERPEEAAVVVSHGNLISMFLQTINDQFSFEDWQKMTNPDVFLITRDEATKEFQYERIFTK